MTHEEFKERFTRLFAKVPRGVVEDYRFVELPAVAAWVNTGLLLGPGQRATALALAGGKAPAFQAWLRMDASGEALSGGRHTHSIVTAKAGALHMSARMANDAPGLPAMEAISVVAIRWTKAPLRCLRYVAGAGDVEGLVRSEIERLCNPAALRP